MAQAFAGILNHAPRFSITPARPIQRLSWHSPGPCQRQSGIGNEAHWFSAVFRRSGGATPSGLMLSRNAHRGGTPPAVHGQYGVSLKHIHIFLFRVMLSHGTSIHTFEARSHYRREESSRSTSPVQNRRFPGRPTGTDLMAVPCRRDGESDRPRLEDDAQERSEVDR
jgi:hypothetical protein